MNFWTPAVLGVLYAQLSTFHTERRSINTLISIIIIIIIIIVVVNACTAWDCEMLSLLFVGC